MLHLVAATSAPGTWDYVSWISAAIAALASLGAVYFAGRTVREAVRAREAAERDSRRHRLERIADCIEQVDILANRDMLQRPVPGDSWKSARSQLQYVLAGLAHEMPRCAVIVDGQVIQTPSAASSAVTTARTEIQEALLRLAEQDS